MSGPLQKSESKVSTREFLRTRAELFKDLSDERLQQLVDGSRVATFESNEVIMHRGEEAAHFGLILSGTVTAEVGNDQRLGELIAGDTFGELSLMSGDPLVADFVAKSPCHVLLVPVSLFQSIIVSEPGAVQRISRTIVRPHEIAHDRSGQGSVCVARKR